MAKIIMFVGSSIFLVTAIMKYEEGCINDAFFHVAISTVLVLHGLLLKEG